MNRILTADVILTLTADQARELVAELECPDSYVLSMGTVQVILEQCAKQGVSL